MIDSQVLDSFRKTKCLVTGGTGLIGRQVVQMLCNAGAAVRVVSLQMEYNLFDRSIEDGILPYCEGQGMTVIAYSPLDQGRVAGGRRGREFLEEIGVRYDKTAAQVALRWLIARPAVVVVSNATSEGHVRENAASAGFDLSGDDVESMDRFFRNTRVSISTDRIRVCGPDGAYVTVEQAIENARHLSPSPQELAASIAEEPAIKPVRVVATSDHSGQYDYDLIEGRMRYWAWVIAHDGRVPIPAYVRESQDV